MDTNKGGGGTQKDHVMGTWGSGGLVWVQICPRGLFTAPDGLFLSAAMQCMTTSICTIAIENILGYYYNEKLL